MTQSSKPTGKDRAAAIGLIFAALAALGAVALVVSGHQQQREEEQRYAADYQKLEQREDSKKQIARCFADRASRQGKEALVMAYWGPREPGAVASYSFPDRPLGPRDVVMRSFDVVDALRKLCDLPKDVQVSEVLAAMSEFDPETQELEAKARQLRVQQEERAQAQRHAAEAQRQQDLSWALKDPPPPSGQPPAVPR